MNLQKGVDTDGKNYRSATEIIGLIYKDALCCGLSPEEFWNMTPQEIRDTVNSRLKQRQNDIYVFSLNTGDTDVSSDPLNLDNWKFYIVPTEVINENCGDAKTISLQRIEKLGFEGVDYFSIREVINQIISKM